MIARFCFKFSIYLIIALSGRQMIFDTCSDTTHLDI